MCQEECWFSDREREEDLLEILSVSESTSCTDYLGQELSRKRDQQAQRFQEGCIPSRFKGQRRGSCGWIQVNKGLRGDIVMEGTKHRFAQSGTGASSHRWLVTFK